MDGHKLLWHTDRVNDWLNGKRIPPIHIDAGLSKGCNIKCHYCFGTVQGNQYKKGVDSYFPKEHLFSYLKEAGEAGVRSIALIGEAEPLLNPHIYDAIVIGKKSGLDLGLGTNGILFDTGSNGEKALERLTWIRFNISAASNESYQKLHASKDFDLFIEKVNYCVKKKIQNKFPITIGFQMVLTPDDVDEVIPLAKLGKELGIDYLEIKHCGDTKNNALGIYNILDTYDKFIDVLKEAEKESTASYRVVVKWKGIREKGKREYTVCYGAPFLIYTSGDGKVYPCGMFFSYREEEFRMGDLTKQSFKEILESEKYWKVVDKVSNDVDTQQECYANCKTNAINKFLWQIKDRPEHVNFV